MRRRAFTLIEVMVALVVTGLIVSVAWSTVQAGFDTEERLALTRAGEEREAVARSIIAAALRHALSGTIGGAPVFELGDGDGASDNLRFRTRGIVEPFGASGVWEVVLVPSERGLLVTGHPVAEGAMPFTSRLPRISAIDVAVKGRGFREGWMATWPTVDRSPVAVRITFRDEDGLEALAPLVVRVGLEGNP